MTDTPSNQAPLPRFHEVLGELLAAHRRDGTLSDERFVQILLGELHAFVQRPDIRSKAEQAVSDLLVRNAGAKTGTDEYVDTVIRAVMEGN